MNQVKLCCWTKSINLIDKLNSQLIDDGSEDKKSKYTKKIVIKKLNLKIIENCLELTQLDNKVKYLIKLTQIVLKEIIKINNRPTLKIQQRFKSESHNMFLLKK